MVKLRQRYFGNFWVVPRMRFSQLWHFGFRSSATWSCVMCVQASVLFWGMQHRVVIPHWHFGTTYQSHLKGSRSWRRMPQTLGHTVYMGKGVATDWFSVSIPANRDDAAWGRWEGGEKSSNSVLLQDKWPASLTLHQPYWLASHLLRTNHCPHLSLYKLWNQVFFFLYDDQPMHN